MQALPMMTVLPHPISWSKFSDSSEHTFKVLYNARSVLFQHLQNVGSEYKIKAHTRISVTKKGIAQFILAEAERITLQVLQHGSDSFQ